jgi:two-component system, OmpR family, response regulator
MRLLLVEDEARLAANLGRGLSEIGFTVDRAADAEGADKALAGADYDLIVLDIRLPGKDGLTFLRERRSAGDTTPVLILTARGSVEERVEGLNAGADDYLPKPFAFAELVARVRALARRNRTPAKTLLQVADLELDTLKRRVSRAGQTIEFSPKEIVLLEFLMRHVNQVVTRDMIAEAVWDSSYNVFTNLIEVFINRIRRKIDRDRPVPLIQTVRGSGYVMRAE